MAGLGDPNLGAKGHGRITQGPVQFRDTNSNTYYERWAPNRSTTRGQQLSGQPFLRLIFEGLAARRILVWY